MVKALIPIKLQLESRIALRYAQQLSRWVDLKIQSIYVIESERAGPLPSPQGWIRPKWEEALIQKAEEEVRQFLDSENLDLNRISETEVVLGDPTEKLLGKLVMGACQLFIQGALLTFDLSDFYSLFESSLYKAMPIPALVVKNPVALDKTAILIAAGDEQTPVSAFLRIFAGSGIQTDIIVYTIDERNEAVSRDTDVRQAWLENLSRTIKRQSVSVGRIKLMEGPVAGITEHLRGYGLVAASVPRNPERQNPKIQILAGLPNPVLICWSESSK